MTHQNIPQQQVPSTSLRPPEQRCVVGQLIHMRRSPLARLEPAQGCLLLAPACLYDPQVVEGLRVVWVQRHRHLQALLGQGQVADAHRHLRAGAGQQVVSR